MKEEVKAISEAALEWAKQHPEARANALGSQGNPE
jgi:hypothetical protein